MTTPMTTRLGLILQTNAAGCFVDFVRPLPCSSFETRHCSLKTRKRIVPAPTMCSRTWVCVCRTFKSISIRTAQTHSG